eukprot:TRINITY_DN10812_c0_g1_i2.p1 TRINITY_DN10812_c0_g1~~TRINITY_DN10812_c0_g1_i2.p1  ORF type:complete len:241 (-),score=40.15 TRINITY_DN10812_c0_g1_i2:212-934(-)
MLDERIRSGENIERERAAEILKPPRSHYCQITKRQVLRMDHFCPWVGNCVGFFNYRYFFLFLSWLSFGCFYGALICSVPFYQCSHTRTADLRRNPICASKAHITFTFVITLSVGIAVSLMLAFHVYLVLSAQTTIEFYYNKFTSKGKRYRGELFLNEYDLGRTKNWHAVFGAGRYYWSWMLPSLQPPPGDGFIYTTRAEARRQKRVVDDRYREELKSLIAEDKNEAAARAEGETGLSVDF